MISKLIIEVKKKKEKQGPLKFLHKKKLKRNFFYNVRLLSVTIYVFSHR